MKSASYPGQIEPLETRIAPASVTILVGAHGAAGNTDYDTTNVDPNVPVFHLTGTSGAGLVDTTAVGGTADTYYIKLQAGDDLEQYDNGFSSLLTVTKGTVIAYFVDANHDKIVDPGELSGISLGNGAVLKLASNLSGSILTNYDDKANKVVMDNLLGPKQSIGGLTLGGQVTGGIYAGGNITNVTDISGDIPKLLTGEAANGVSFSLLGNTGVGTGVLSITPAVGESGGSISNIFVKSIGVLQAGAGGAGGKGGSISSVNILSDTDGMVIKAGDGGIAASGKSGGLGGSLSKIFVSGATDTTLNDTIQILAGNGGSGAMNTGSKGGAGGQATSIFVGYDSVSGKPQASGGLLADNVEIGAGNGGDGKTGGNGGALGTVQVLVRTLDSAAVADEINLHAGNGGAPNDATGGAAGSGGSATGISVMDQQFTVGVAASILVSAGKAGAPAIALAKGGNGGSVTSVSVLGFDTAIVAGDASSGSIGGKGGSISKITLLSQDTIIPNVVAITAGTGGSGLAGNGGTGGSVTTLTMANSDLAAFTINAGTAGDGGSSVGGKGGDGGAVSGFDLVDTNNPSGPAFDGVFNVRSGKGGNGDKGGGKGGALINGNFFAVDLEIDAFAGAGGNATSDGSGGAGGIAKALNLTSDGLHNGVQVNGLLKSGAGGNGAGKGSGGTAGDVSVVNLDVAGNVEVDAGIGGTGTATSGGGGGGNISAVGAFGRDGTGKLSAGDAGVGVKAAKGGSILGSKSQVSGLRAEKDLTITAGNGGGGGDGGSIVGLSFGSTSNSLSPTPSGNILVQAGNGSAAGDFAGKGGSINQVSGNPSSGINTTTQLLGGTGSNGTKKGADGGSISNVFVSGVGDDSATALVPNPVTILFQAGDAGSAAAGTAGGNGGNVTNVIVNDLDPDAIIRSVAAGNGGNSAGKGGMGGTINGFRVTGGTDAVTGATLSGDIGYRSGKAYGFTSMGGIFAGTGGTGATPGLAGSVRNIAADSIAAIVAGRDDAPLEVQSVDHIYLNGLTSLKTVGNSPFTVTYGGNETTPVITSLDPSVVQIALDNLAAPAPDNVIVVHTATSSFQITDTVNETTGNYTGEEDIADPVTDTVPGNPNLVIKETIPGTTVNQESQAYVPYGNGTYTLTFGGKTTTALNYNDSNTTVANALNTLTSVSGAGGVAVSGDPTNGFTVKFNFDGARAAITGQAQVKESQTLDVLGIGDFDISYNGTKTSTRVANGSTAQQVSDAINQVLTTAGTGLSVTVALGTDSSYVVTFDQPGENSLFQVTEYTPMNAVVITAGSANTKTVQGLSFIPRATFDSTAYAKANLVGAIADPNEIGSPTFKFTPQGAVHAGFALGDKPTDGIIVAKTLDQTTVNFTPEASLVGGVFFDSDNQI